MNFIYFKHILKYVSIFLFINVLIGCSHSTIKTEKDHIQQRLEKFNENDLTSTGTSFTFQCPKYNNGNEITFNNGLQSIDGVKTQNNSLL